MVPKKKELLERCIDDGLRKAAEQIKDSRTKPDTQLADDLRFDAILCEVEDAFDFDSEVVISLSEKLK